MMGKIYNPMPSAEVLTALLLYDPCTGRLTWKPRNPEDFRARKNTAEQNCKTWNKKYAGKSAFTATANGYAKGSVLDADFLAHRIIWKMMTSKDPAGEIDHINGCRSDNRWLNLRDVTVSENAANKRLRTSNETGCNGVTLFKRDGTWRARIKDQSRGVEVHLGYFANMEDAVVARRRAEREFGYHENHGTAAE